MKIRATHIYQSERAEGFIDPKRPGFGQISCYPNEEEVIHVVVPREVFEQLTRRMIQSLEERLPPESGFDSMQT